jgi:hypothetical protein
MLATSARTEIVTWQMAYKEVHEACHYVKGCAVSFDKEHNQQDMFQVDNPFFVYG